MDYYSQDLGLVNYVSYQEPMRTICSSLAENNKSDLERVQKTAVKIILWEKYSGYKKALDYFGLLTLEERRENLYNNVERMRKQRTFLNK